MCIESINFSKPIKKRRATTTVEWNRRGSLNKKLYYLYQLNFNVLISLFETSLDDLLKPEPIIADKLVVVVNIMC